MGSSVGYRGPQHVQGLESRTHHSAILPGKFGQLKLIVVAPVIADVVAFIEAELQLLEEATLLATGEGLTLAGWIEAFTAAVATGET